MNKVVVVIVTFNRLTKLQKALEIYTSSMVSHVVIVDNASTDGTAQFLQSLTSGNTHILSMPENLGGSGGFHEGIKYVHQQIEHYDWVLVQDDDAYPDISTLNSFVQTGEAYGADAIISAIYYPSGGICEMNRPGFLPFKSLRQGWNTLIKGNRGFHIDDIPYLSNTSCQVDFASFVGLFINKEIVEAIGFPDKSWFIYGDDLDYTTRFTQQGFKLYFNPHFVFYHDCLSLSSGSPNHKTYSDLWRAFFMYRNGLIIYKKLAGKLFPFVFLFKLSSWLLAITKYPNRVGYLKILCVAVKDGLLNNRKKKMEEVRRLLS
jgi:rhamnopyranosyl-N-acetylglucosaminyl-diphospho-decaprenol beta-1,3/1,4-galactofuranosyltransferase